MRRQSLGMVGQGQLIEVTDIIYHHIFFLAFLHSTVVEPLPSR